MWPAKIFRGRKTVGRQQLQEPDPIPAVNGQRTLLPKCYPTQRDRPRQKRTGNDVTLKLSRLIGAFHDVPGWAGTPPCDFAPLGEPDNRASPLVGHASRSIPVG